MVPSINPNITQFMIKEVIDKEAFCPFYLLFMINTLNLGKYRIHVFFFKFCEDRVIRKTVKII